MRVAIIAGNSPRDLEAKTNARLARIEDEGGAVVNVRVGSTVWPGHLDGAPDIEYMATVLYRPTEPEEAGA